MIELTQQRQHAVDAGEELRLIDLRTQKKTYILVESGVFERLHGRLADDDGLDMRQSPHSTADFSALLWF